MVNLVNYFRGHFSNGPVEGINNKSKLIKRRAFGYLTFADFRRRVIVEFATKVSFHRVRWDLKRTYVACRESVVSSRSACWGR